MEKQRLDAGIPTPVVLPDTPFTRRLNAVMKDGRVVLLDRHSCAVYYRHHAEVVRLKEVDIRRDKAGYYVLI